MIFSVGRGGGRKAILRGGGGRGRIGRGGRRPPPPIDRGGGGSFEGKVGYLEVIKGLQEGSSGARILVGTRQSPRLLAFKEGLGMGSAMELSPFEEGIIISGDEEGLSHVGDIEEVDMVEPDVMLNGGSRLNNDMEGKEGEMVTLLDRELAKDDGLKEDIEGHVGLHVQAAVEEVVRQQLGEEQEGRCIWQEGGALIGKIKGGEVKENVCLNSGVSYLDSSNSNLICRRDYLPNNNPLYLGGNSITPEININCMMAKIGSGGLDVNIGSNSISSWQGSKHHGETGSKEVGFSNPCFDDGYEEEVSLKVVEMKEMGDEGGGLICNLEVEGGGRRKEKVVIKSKFHQLPYVGKVGDISNSDGAVIIDNSLYLSNKAKLNGALVGRIMGKALPFVFLKTELQKMWGGVGDFQI